MSAPRNKRKLAALNKESCEEHARSSFAQNSKIPRLQEDHITQICQKNEERVTKRLSQEFNKTENRMLGALAHLDDFLMNPQTQGYSKVPPETSRNAFSTSQGTHEDNYQSHPHPEAGKFHNQRTRSFGPEEGHDKF